MKISSIFVAFLENMNFSLFNFVWMACKYVFFGTPQFYLKIMFKYGLISIGQLNQYFGAGNSIYLPWKNQNPSYWFGE